MFWVGGWVGGWVLQYLIRTVFSSSIHPYEIGGWVGGWLGYLLGVGPVE